MCQTRWQDSDPKRKGSPGISHLDRDCPAGHPGHSREQEEPGGLTAEETALAQEPSGRTAVCSGAGGLAWPRQPWKGRQAQVEDREETGGKSCEKFSSEASQWGGHEDRTASWCRAVGRV